MCCVPTKGIIFRHDLLPFNNSKSTIIFIEYKQGPVLEWPGYSPDMNHIKGVWNIMKKGIGNQKPHKRKICGSVYVKRGIV